ncbi:hypothetical protein CPB83DRAFT_842185 [Crepidotus variabilis]|uniref:DASH complex subunit ASK1 n=1 Tax=Crepidotus variabilis TaxID=179855 RepID=A0A9P6ET50_9AGAR|nr:hypothetical protein CPB83DRAFT_842185 [Crepidotus variabilis]
MSEQKPIPPNPNRWKPNLNPANIVVPGLDTEASTSDQIEQIEQLITIKLQNIDENFSKIHNVLANKLLPAVKRYSVGTEPVREAAKFWTSFYEQAAQIRIPTFDDYSTVNDVPSERDENTMSEEHQGSAVEVEASADHTQRPDDIYETTVNSETSFLPGHGAFSSTPATAARIASTNQSYSSQVSDDPSWAQSPLVKLSQELKHFSLQPEAQPQNSSSSTFDSILEDSSTDSTEDETVSIPRSAKGKAKETPQPLLKNVLRHNLYSASDSSTFENNLKQISPLKFKAKPKTPLLDKKSNPYLPPSGDSSSWSGVVDLRDRSVLTPQRQRQGRGDANKSSTTPGAPLGDDDDDSFEALPPGMSPPVLMSPVRPARSSTELGLHRLGQTPIREASERIQRDLIKSALKSVHKSGLKNAKLSQRQQVVDSSMSTVPTPPSLSRYTRRHDFSTTDSSIDKDPSLESMIRHLSADIKGNKYRRTSTKPIPKATNAGPSIPSYMSSNQHLQQSDFSIDSDSDSMEFNDTANPSAAFLMASGGAAAYMDDDSFGSSNNSSDSLENDGVGALGDGIVPVHPFAANVAVLDDGFDDEDDDSSDGFEVGPAGGLAGGQVVDDFEDETVFGVGPRQSVAGVYDGRNLRMLGEDLLEDTIGIGAHMAATGRVEESPTPANWGR